VVKKEKERGGRGGEKKEKDRKKFPENMGKTGSPCASRYVRGGYVFPCFLQVVRPHGKDGKKKGRGEEEGKVRQDIKKKPPLSGGAGLADAVLFVP